MRAIPEDCGRENANAERGCSAEFVILRASMPPAARRAQKVARRTFTMMSMRVVERLIELTQSPAKFEVEMGTDKGSENVELATQSTYKYIW